MALSPQDEIRLGADAWNEVRRTSRPANNPQLKQVVGTVSARIIQATGAEGRGLPWEYELFENDEANAFALPGGKIGVNTGIFKVAKNEDQLATVLGHEVRHVTGHHGAQRYQKQMMTGAGLQLASLALGAGNVQGANEIMSLLGAGAQVGIILPFSRDNETEADMVGLEYMAAAGFNPRESVPFWQNMMAAGGGGRGPSFLSTHPAGQDRITNLTRKIQEIEARRGKA